MTIESPFVFYPRHAWETLKKVWGHLRVYRQLKAVLNDVLAAPTAGPTATLRLIRVRSACALPPDHRRRAALSRKRRDNAIRAATIHRRSQEATRPKRPGRNGKMAAPWLPFRFLHPESYSAAGSAAASSGLTAALAASFSRSSRISASRLVATSRRPLIMAPVPAGIRRPTMTFSLSPSSVSALPLTAASVSTRVVS